MIVALTPIPFIFPNAGPGDDRRSGDDRRKTR